LLMVVSTLWVWQPVNIRQRLRASKVRVKRMD
jgi:hypothetical protein